MSSNSENSPPGASHGGAPPTTADPADQPPSNKSRSNVDWLGLETKLSHEEQTEIYLDSRAFVIAQLVEDFNAQQITDKLCLAGIPRTEAAALVKEILTQDKSLIKSTRRGNGLRKFVGGIVSMAIGFAFVGVGVVVGMEGLAFAGPWIFFAGVWFTVKGLRDGIVG